MSADFRSGFFHPQAADVVHELNVPRFIGPWTANAVVYTVMLFAPFWFAYDNCWIGLVTIWCENLVSYSFSEFSFSDSGIIWDYICYCIAVGLSCYRAVLVYQTKKHGKDSHKGRQSGIQSLRIGSYLCSSSIVFFLSYCIEYYREFSYSIFIWLFLIITVVNCYQALTLNNQIRLALNNRQIQAAAMPVDGLIQASVAPVDTQIQFVAVPVGVPVTTPIAISTTINSEELPTYDNVATTKPVTQTDVAGYCRKCGTGYADQETAFCPKCGTPKI